MFEDISSTRPVTTELTPREREVAQFLVAGKSSKQIAKDLKVGHRTVDAHRARLMLKFNAASTAELIARYWVGTERHASALVVPAQSLGIAGDLPRFRIWRGRTR